MDADGNNRKQLTNDSAADLQAAASPDGRYIVFVSNRGGKDELWRIDSDGSHPTRLTPTDGVQFPSFSPDGRWVVYEGNGKDNLVLWRVSVEGGNPIQLTQEIAHRPVVSADGKTIACFMPNDAPGAAKLALLDLPAGDC